jgi:hypothetical protein
MDISSLRNLPVSRLFLEPPKLGCPHLLRAIDQSRPYVQKQKSIMGNMLIVDIEWQWDQLRVMKVGGNESATKFFQSNGGSAALNSKDPTTKYTSNAATKYKEELKRRAARDATE